MQDESISNVDQAKRWLAQDQAALKAAGVNVIRVTYNGSGDEGNFQGIEFLDENERNTVYEVPAEIKALLEALTDELATPGYEDNDGGGGEIRLVVDTGVITHESYYYTVQRNADDYQEF